MIHYKVKTGDTVRKIAKKHYGRARKSDLIVSANELVDAESLKVGQVLEIPEDPNITQEDKGPALHPGITMTERPARWSGTRRSGRGVAGIVVHSIPQFARHNKVEHHAADWLDRQYDLLMDGEASGPKASAHGLVEPNGELIWTVPWSRVAYHAGKSKFKHWSGLNGWFLGVGLLVKGCHTDATFAKALQLPGIVPYSDEQYATLAWVVDQAMRRFGFPRSHVVGHHTVSPGREIDPGPKFSWKRLDGHLDELQPVG